MLYEIKILTTSGFLTSHLETNLTLDGYPFGYVGYRQACSCDKSQTELDAFWDLVDIILVDHGLDESSFVRAVSALDVNSGILYGETP